MLGVPTTSPTAAATTNMPQRLLQALCRTNQGLLDQKSQLLQTLLQKLGAERSSALYIQHAPNGSIGQHLRHSLDHMAYAVNAAAQDDNNVHYDRRQRSTPDEQSMDHALKRIATLHDQFQHLTTTTQKDDALVVRPVTAYFLLSSDSSSSSSNEAGLPSTVGRELGFAAHHAMHHMALLQRILVIESKILTADELPPNFGTAPSTTAYHNQQQEQQEQ